ncbi:MAG TPA: hypothetical protein VFQ01_03950 [Nocardioides sp.]|nr:hypothetical protein [Nocardioides sp.]
MSEQSTEPSDQFAAEVEDDVEGHVQPPREDDTTTCTAWCASEPLLPVSLFRQ